MTKWKAYQNIYVGNANLIALHGMQFVTKTAKSFVNMIIMNV